MPAHRSLSLLILFSMTLLVGCSSTPQEKARRLLDYVGAKLRLNGEGQVVAVDLRDSAADDDALAAVGEFPLVTTINCNGAQRITGIGLANLAKLKHLDSLYLAHTKLNDAGLANVRHLRSLTTLQLNGTDVTDEGMRALDELPNLRMLSLGNTAITDHGLVQLRDLRKLETLSLSDTSTTKRGALELQRTLPDVRIVR